MNNQEQNEAIARACGLERLAKFRRQTRRGAPDSNGRVTMYCEEDHGGASTWAPIPNYVGDLNAIHRATSVLSPDDQDNFAEQLSALVLENPHHAWWDLNCNEVAHVANATATQRAEAVLRTLNLWNT